MPVFHAKAWANRHAALTSWRQSIKRQSLAQTMTNMAMNATENE
jgi:hypothetical protein